MKKISYITNSQESFDYLADTEVTRIPIAKAGDSDFQAVFEKSDIILIDQTDPVLAEIKRDNQPLLLLCDDPHFADCGRSELVSAGLNGIVTKETFRLFFNQLLMLKAVDTSYDWEVVLSMVSPFAQAACEVLATTASTRIKVLGFVIGYIIPPEGELGSSMHFYGDIEGEAVAIFNIHQARKLAAGIAICSESDLVDEDLLDGVSEIINQVSGRMRSMEWSNNLRFNIGLPNDFHLAKNNQAINNSSGWVTILIECHSQICTVSLKASKVANPAVSL